MALWINDGLHEAAADIHSFLLVGQSNMAGRGDLTKENAITAPDCFMLRMGRWQEMSEPINVDRAVVEGAVPRSGANLAASFAAQLQKETGAKIGLIPCADGGTRISQWQPGEVPCFRQGWHSVLLRLRRFYGIRVRATALHRNSWKPTPNSFSARCRRSGKNSAICPSWWANWAGRKTAFTEHPQNCCTNSTVVCRSGQRSCPGVP